MQHGVDDVSNSSKKTIENAKRNGARWLYFYYCSFHPCFNQQFHTKDNFRIYRSKWHLFSEIKCLFLLTMSNFTPKTPKKTNKDIIQPYPINFVLFSSHSLNCVRLSTWILDFPGRSLTIARHTIPLITTIRSTPAPTYLQANSIFYSNT